MRLQGVAADPADDATNSNIDSSSANNASSGRKRKARIQNVPSMASPQSSERRRPRSTNESPTTNTKRRKQTAASKSELSVATHADESTTTSNRRQTRSLSKQIQTQSKTVTPSPASTTGKTKFSFSSPTKTKDEIREKVDAKTDDERCDRLPWGVISIYREPEIQTNRSEAAAQSPTNRRARTRRGRKEHQLQKQLDEFSNRYKRPATMKTGAGAAFDSSTTESLTVDYMRTYGEDYSNYLRENEFYFVSPSPAPTEFLYRKGNERSKSSSFGSPDSRRSTSSSSCSSTCSSKWTPEDQKFNGDSWSYFDRYHDDTERDPHLAPHNSRKMTAQPNLSAKMRCILVDWLIELSEHFDFGQETLHLAVTLVDRVLASGFDVKQEAGNWSTGNRRPKEDDGSDCDSCSHYDDDKSEDTHCYVIPRDRFQLLGVTCVWLACKIKERTPPKVKEISYVSDHIYSIEQITRMERRVLNALEFDLLAVTTPHQFLFEFMRASFAGLATAEELEKGDILAPRSIPAHAIGVGMACDSVFRDMANYLLELGRLPYGPSTMLPSKLAAAAVYLARVTLGIPRALKDGDKDCSLAPYFWSRTLLYYTGYDRWDLELTVLEIRKYQLAAETSSLKAVFNKYKSKKYNRVALKTVPRVEDLGFNDDSIGLY